MLAIVLTALVCAPLPLAGQTWTAEAQAGRLRYDVGAGLVESANVGVGIRYVDTRSWGQLSVGVPLAEDDGLWIGGGSWQRLAIRRGGVTFGADLTGYAFGSRQRVRRAGGLLDPVTTSTVSGFALSGEALPLLAWSSGRFNLEGRAGVAHYYRDAGDSSLSRSARIGDVKLEVTAASNVVLNAIVRRFDAEEGAYTNAGLAIFLAPEPLQLWAAAGYWFDAEDHALPWAAGASLSLMDRVRFNLAGRRETIDPLYGAPPRTTWSVGMSYTFASPVNPAEPVPASYVDGQATIELPHADVHGRPSVAGDFNGWTPAVMVRAGNTWTYTVQVEPGVYQYAFVDEDGVWFVPESVPGRRDDGMGGHVAVLVVQ